MTTINQTLSNTYHQSAPWIERLARWGYAAKGVVYVLLGILALMAALGQGDKNASKQGVAELIFEQPFGKFLAILVVIGIIGFVVWRFVQAFKGVNNGDEPKKKAVNEVRYISSGLAYLAFAITLIKMVAGSGSSGGNKQQWLTKLLDTGIGPFLVVLAGVIIMGAGIYQWVKAYKGDFMEKLRVNGVAGHLRDWVKRIGKIGYAARGIVWLLIGFFLLRAGMQSDASEAQGSEGAFDMIQQFGGNWVLLIVAIGVVAYGVFMFVKAKYYQIQVGR